MKQMLFTLIVIGLVYPMSWLEFVKLEPSQKYAIMSNNLEKMINATTPTLPKDELISILRYFKPEEAKLIKVGNQYISEKVCKENPSLCEIKNETKSTPPTSKPLVRTIVQCLDAREKDWQNWCWINPKIDCANAPASAKKEILDNLAKSENSNQGRCLRGE